MTERDVSLIDEGKSEREQFEAAWKAHGRDLYDSFETCAWEFWQASRRTALEEAAETVLQSTLDAHWGGPPVMDCREVASICANAIRALSSP